MAEGPIRSLHRALVTFRYFCVAELGKLDHIWKGSEALHTSMGFFNSHTCRENVLIAFSPLYGPQAGFGLLGAGAHLVKIARSHIQQEYTSASDCPRELWTHSYLVCLVHAFDRDHRFVHTSMKFSWLNPAKLGFRFNGMSSSFM